ncbi:hypothetical protein SAMN05877809_10567 [Rhodobacter sp. JA431]|uniref:hypothetical protein n=1 Tax=Rhodobacter sp. JA431 TaxID=570013 RepID=UPI000BC8C88E|nr:hypothetical protein [Rhodobacter sp. JA431]SOC10103.1 hypothetical protein SAMN05877809_10567 [Rhodobacter sp. JA431]
MKRFLIQTFLTASLVASPGAAQDRVQAYLDMFDTWCLSRLQDPTQDWEAHYPKAGHGVSSHFEVNNIPQSTYKRVYEPFGLALEQEKHTCRVSEEDPKFTLQEGIALQDGLTRLMARRYPDLLVQDDRSLSAFDLNRTWTDGPAGTEKAHWGVIYLKFGGDLEGTGTTLALPRGSGL